MFCFIPPSLGAKLEYYFIEIGLFYRDFDPSRSQIAIQIQLQIAVGESFARWKSASDF